MVRSKRKIYSIPYVDEFGNTKYIRGYLRGTPDNIIIERVDEIKGYTGGKQYDTTKRPTLMRNSIGTYAQVYSNGNVLITNPDGSMTQRKFGSRPTALRQFLGGAGGWRIVEE